ncbi:MAG: hypothetical protein DMG39_12170 [Acidobacteria bacterium]|nr:MAG: hypothetical protein DMG39_12170 [Acidobacteriota bacterium]
MGGRQRVLAAMCLLACAYTVAGAQEQEEGELSAKQRILPEIGPGLRAVRQGADGRLYVLASPSPGLVVVDAKGKQLLSINEQSPAAGASNSLMAFGDDCDVDAEGKIYVADRGANLIRVFSPAGSLLRSIPVKNPVSVAAMPEEEVAVATLREPHLVIVFDKNGKEVREFGDPEPISEREDLNRFLNIGQLGADAQGHLYYAFEYLPEPTVRQYDRLGYAGQDIQYTAIDALPTAVAVRKEIERQEQKGKEPSFKRVLTGLGVDRSNGEIWMALNNNLLHFDSAGNRRATYKIYTPQGARLEANTILVEKDRLIIGSDPLGLYLFDRPDKRNTK